MKQSMEGQCGCGAIRYRLTDTPLLVHCCHCTWCQRETGSAFALNAMIESHQLVLLQGSPDVIVTPSNSGKGQKIVRCPDCRVAVWSHYGGGGESISFVRVGTLDNPAMCPPDVHIFVSSKQPWVILPKGIPAFEEYYQRSKTWPQASLDRLQKLRDSMAQ
ncbi:MAG TPA: GFA family protein [Xanthomonadales bacterium]|nr:GFA family protein [Xanthomonadales bacterium]